MNLTRTAIKSIARAFSKDEDGATAIEYGLFAALVGAVIVATVASLGQETNKGFQAMETALKEQNSSS
ncbi:Flp family type IVb pilin [Litoreibacter albidus]|uniref:Pilus assembly protein Flp/PilA n=1 Tax=Litoreibacter albidus TaxID=670155 RepID=A0A1H2QLB1_9RHOB|nr:Flp family type IVb pilin [Litoreibacter albidus]SDW07678.1 pilus assembly protein Flp/PilA [Litoreibacter albidus]